MKYFLCSLLWHLKFHLRFNFLICGRLSSLQECLAKMERKKGVENLCEREYCKQLLDSASINQQILLRVDWQPARTSFLRRTKLSVGGSVVLEKGARETKKEIGGTKTNFASGAICPIVDQEFRILSRGSDFGRDQTKQQTVYKQGMQPLTPSLSWLRWLTSQCLGFSVSVMLACIKPSTKLPTRQAMCCQLVPKISSLSCFSIWAEKEVVVPGPCCEAQEQVHD